MKSRKKNYRIGFLEGPNDDLQGNSKSKMKLRKNIPFTVNHAVLDQFYSFDTALSSRCNTDFFCLMGQNSASSKSNTETFSTS